MRQRIQRLQEHPWVWWPLFALLVIGAPQTVLGVPEMPEKVAGLGWLVAWVDDDVARWILPGVGLVTLLAILAVLTLLLLEKHEPRRSAEASPTQEAAARSSGGIRTEGLKQPGPASSDAAAASFDTRNRVHHVVKTQGKPQSLRFTLPSEQTVRADELPASLLHNGMVILLVKRFTEEGFAIEEKTTGVRVRAEVHYQKGSGSPPPPPERTTTEPENLPPSAEPSLKDELEQLLAEGRRLRQGIPDRLPGGLGAAYVLLGGVKTTGEQVERWQANVEALLAGDQQRLNVFLYDPPSQINHAARSLSRILVSPLQEQMDRRLVQLERVIRNL